MSTSTRAGTRLVRVARSATVADHDAEGTGAPPPKRQAPRSPGFRADIEGLRAFAVLSVLVYHLQPGWLPGGFAGVDVFFVISGYLITTHLVGEVLRTGRLSMTRFYGRRILRLLPASTLVLVLTAAATALLVPRYVWGQFGADTVSAATYRLNWALAARSVDYLAEDSVASPVQHFWSLGVEEQFYLVWPLVIIGLAGLAGRQGWQLRTVLAVGGAAIGLASFTLTVAQVAAGEPSAYFTTTTRIWELAVGGLVALALPRLQPWLGRRLRGVVVGLGVVALTGSVTLLSGDGWPGWPALLPTAGAVLVVVAGGGDRPVLFERLLGVPVLVWLGGVSYSLYLWHWPLVTLAHFRWSQFGPGVAVGIAGGSILLAWASQRLVENPLRAAPWLRARPWRPFGLAGLCLAVSLGAGGSLLLIGPSQSLLAPAGARPEGAAVLPAHIDLSGHPAWSDGVTWVLPAPAAALEDVPAAYADHCQQSVSDADPVSCSYGNLTSSRVVAVVGDSKAVQWLPALETWARQRGLRIQTYVKSSCPLTDAMVDLAGAQYTSCRAWYGNVMAELLKTRPAVVLTSQVRQGASAAGGDPEQARLQMVDGLVRTWQRLTEAGSQVVVVADTPQTGTNVYECVAEHSDMLSRCQYDRSEAVRRSAAPAQAAAVRALGGASVDASGRTTAPGGNPAVSLVDLTDAVCPDARSCPPVVGNALIYRSGSHLTKTYVDSLEPRLGRLLDQVVPS